MNSSLCLAWLWVLVHSHGCGCLLWCRSLIINLRLFPSPNSGYLPAFSAHTHRLSQAILRRVRARCPSPELCCCQQWPPINALLTFCSSVESKRKFCGSGYTKGLIVHRGLNQRDLFSALSSACTTGLYRIGSLWCFCHQIWKEWRWYMQKNGLFRYPNCLSSNLHANKI